MIATVEHTHGPPGSRIQGSQMFRWYCGGCGQAMRVTAVPRQVNRWAIQCHVCNGEKKRLMPGGTAGPPDQDANGVWGNIITALDS